MLSSWLIFSIAAMGLNLTLGYEAALLMLGTPVQSVTTTDDVLRRPDFRAQDWSLAYLQVLAASAAALAIGALLLNLAERQRSRSLASAMVRRMGVTRRSMRLASRWSSPRCSAPAPSSAWSWACSRVPSSPQVSIR